MDITKMSTHKEISSWVTTLPYLSDIVSQADSYTEFKMLLQDYVDTYFSSNPHALSYSRYHTVGYAAFQNLSWQDYGCITLYHLLENEGESFFDGNYRETITSTPLKCFWDTLEKKNKLSRALWQELRHLFEQAGGHNSPDTVGRDHLHEWMDRHPTGLDDHIIARRRENKARIIAAITDEIERGECPQKYAFDPSLSRQERIAQVEQWWKTSAFHLAFAVRDTARLFSLLGNSLDTKTARIMREAEERGIPIFVNPYYLSLLNCGNQQDLGDDLAIRQYIFYSENLNEEFGHIRAWEKEDSVEIGKPNAAGWLLPSHNIHRRYPEVAILIPETIGRACGGLCSSCQRMYGFQSGDLNFDLSKLAPKQSWKDKLECLLNYYEEDSQLRDILITGGDALMSKNRTLRYILTRVLEMAQRKKEKNAALKRNFAEISRIRLGTRLPVYLPQRVDTELCDTLRWFKTEATALGIDQCVIQTHFESAMEITPEAEQAVQNLSETGWYITNQQVFTAAASRRGHTAKLRKTLNECGVIPYYTFSVKGFFENKENFATNARIVQEKMEEKSFGYTKDDLSFLVTRTTNMAEEAQAYMKQKDLPFIAVDRSVLNLPGVGKSLTFRTVGFTDDGRRILDFDHDHNRVHSPITENMGRVIIVESKSLLEYLQELETMGEDPHEYKDIFGYRLCETEPRNPFYEYPTYTYSVSDHLTNFKMPGEN
ncbi:KamA family radical SAM protein [Chitinivibrio alkaliphilus]|uniref:KamA family protein n=1 Tax=Chitinivibrio alkaliphilus ACht1 TaxID=1313304 RepID=U7D7H4_9BACT|nr:KamA family protein [Chitinivibrio alkaliphilus]ERP31531.1 KamA family protein [Chitinivibrio alkaliphilus ACht1]